MFQIKIFNHRQPISRKILSHETALARHLWWTDFTEEFEGYVPIEKDLTSNISNTRKSVSSDFQTPRSRLEKRGAAEFFLTNFEVFENRRKHSFECLI